MTAWWRRALKLSPFYDPVKRILDGRRQRAEVAAWERGGRPVPPPQGVKLRALLQYARDHGLRVLVETGTYRGDMVENTRRSFDRVYSIELSPELHAQARIRFHDAANVVLIQGDSGAEIGRVLEAVQQPALFWLDGHYSAGETARGASDTPVLEELAQVLARPQNDVIVIDDARCFGRDEGYPSLEALGNFVRSKRPNLLLTVEDDMIRITPPRRP